MKTIELANYGVQEMNTSELKETDGGCLLLIAAGICLVAGVIAGIKAARSNSAESVSE